MHECRLSQVSIVCVGACASLCVLGYSLLHGCGPAHPPASEEPEAIIQQPDLTVALPPGHYSGIDPCELFTEMAAELDGKEGEALEAAIQAEICRAAVDVGVPLLVYAIIRALGALDTGVPPSSEQERRCRALLEQIADLRTLSHGEAAEACRVAADAKDWTAYFATLHGRAERRLYGEVVVGIPPMGDPVWQEPHFYDRSSS